MISTSLSFALYSSVTTVLVKMEVHTCQGRTWMACGNFRKTLKKKARMEVNSRGQSRSASSLLYTSPAHIYINYISLPKNYS